MSSAAVSGDFVLEVVSPDKSRRIVPISEMPFLIGRGKMGNQLDLADSRISRQCAAIVSEDNQYRLEDRGHRRGVFVNGAKIERHHLVEGDLITFGLSGSYELIFRSSRLDADSSIQNILSRIESIPRSDSSPAALAKINLLLEATMLLHSQLPLETVLATMLDHAVSVTGADRGLLLEANQAGVLRSRLARGKGGTTLATETIEPSRTALRQATQQQSSVIAEDVNLPEAGFHEAKSVVVQQLRAVVAIPLYAITRADPTDPSAEAKSLQFLGVLYFDSRSPAAFSKLDRQILDAIGVEAASILDNARLVERERERQRMEQELTIARDIQHALLPSGLRQFPHLSVNGTNTPCLAVGGDYFDVFPLSEDRTAFLIADVSGKGLGAALLTTMLQGALSSMTIGTDPARLFEHINRFLCDHSEVGRYATLFFGILDCAGRLDYINAGHPLPILLRQSHASEPCCEGAVPVGLLPGTQYVSTSVQLQPEDTLVLFSDGVTEAQDPEQEMYGDARLREVLLRHAGESLDDIRKAVLDSVEDFIRGASPTDDVTLLLVRYRDPSSVISTPG